MITVYVVIGIFDCYKEVKYDESLENDLLWARNVQFL